VSGPAPSGLQPSAAVNTSSRPEGGHASLPGRARRAGLGERELRKSQLLGADELDSSPTADSACENHPAQQVRQPCSQRARVMAGAAPAAKSPQAAQLLLLGLAGSAQLPALPRPTQPRLTRFDPQQANQSDPAPQGCSQPRRRARGRCLGRCRNGAPEGTLRSLVPSLSQGRGNCSAVTPGRGSPSLPLETFEMETTRSSNLCQHRASRQPQTAVPSSRHRRGGKHTDLLTAVRAVWALSDSHHGLLSPLL